MQTAERADEPRLQLARTITEAIERTRETANRTFFRLGYLLYRVKTERLWEAEGDESFDHYVARDGIDLKRSTAYKLSRLWETFGVRLGLPEPEIEEVARLDSVKLEMLAPHLTAENWRGMVAEIAGLTRRDVRLRVQEIRRHGRPLTISQSMADVENPEEYTQQNLAIAHFHAQVIDSVRFDGRGLTLVTDGGHVLRVWAGQGGETLLHVAGTPPP